MADDVKPALTAEEWRGLGDPEQEITRADRDGSPVVFMTHLGWASASARHAIAAYALYGQPFGFDDGDRALLYLLAEVLPNRGNIAEEHVARLWAMAGKVAALLPPEPTDG